jgi:hypothetical protein
VQVSVAFSHQPKRRVKNLRREPNHEVFVSWTTIGDSADSPAGQRNMPAERAM